MKYNQFIRYITLKDKDSDFITLKAQQICYVTELKKVKIKLLANIWQNSSYNATNKHVNNNSIRKNYTNKTALIIKDVIHNDTETALTLCVPNSIYVHRQQGEDYNSNERWGHYSWFNSQIIRKEIIG